jgi:hypothetical protein
VDVKDFSEWLLTEYEPRPLRPVTVEDTLRKLRNLEACGLDVAAFCADPLTARDRAKGVLADKARKEGHALRCYQVALNRVVAYMVPKDARWKVVKYRLAPESKSRRPTQEQHQLAALESYKGRDKYETARRRALIWSVRATRLRRGEHSRMRLRDWRRDYDPAFGAVLVVLPGKRGHPRAIPVPEAAWDPAGVMQAWFRMRKPDRDQPDALWTRKDGLVYRALRPVDMTVEMNAISKEVGFRVSFNRLRRFEFTRLKKRRVAPWTRLYLHGGSSYRILEHYLGDMTPDEAHKDLLEHVPEFAQGGLDVAARGADGAHGLEVAPGLVGATDVKGPRRRVQAGGRLGHDGSTA